MEGAALIGDAACYNDPIIGQGLSLVLRDVRALSELLCANPDWSVEQLRPYADKRRERSAASPLHKRRCFRRCTVSLVRQQRPVGNASTSDCMQAGDDPELRLALAAVHVGPEKLPPTAFEVPMREKVLQSA